MVESTTKSVSKYAKNIIEIYDVRDSNGNKWYNVPYLAQEMVYVDYPTSEQTDKDLAQFKESVPNVLKVLKTSRRFTTKVNQNKLFIFFTYKLVSLKFISIFQSEYLLTPI